MKILFRKLLTIAALPLALAASAVEMTDATGVKINVNDASRIIAVGGDVTEIVFALGAGDRVIARDDTSYYPPSVAELPSVGYMRTLSPEGVLSMNPSVIVATETAGPPPTIMQLRNAGVPLVLIEKGHDFTSVISKIERIAMAVHATNEGEALIETLKTQRKALDESLAGLETSPKVMLLMNARRGTLMAAGEGTAADAMISLAGARNALSGFEGYKNISNEAALAAQPEVILLPSHGSTQVGGVDGIASMPELKDTPAVKRGKIIEMDSLYLLMFGPRFLNAAAELAERIHPGYQAPEALKPDSKKPEES